METNTAQEAKPRTLTTLLEWQAPSRVFKKRDKEYYTTIAAIVFLLAVILLFLKEWLLIATMIALTFVVYVMGTIPPENVSHKITNRGITTGDKNYDWESLNRFWLEEKWGQHILYIETKMRFPRVLILLLGEQDKTKAVQILIDYLPEEKPEKTWMDNASSWLTKKFPLEK